MNSERLSGSVALTKDGDQISHLWTSPARNWQLAIKRVVDVVVSTVSLVILLPFFVLIALSIKLDSRGPVFFTQLRWGANGKKISVYKFRSMKTELCDATGVAQTMENDPRVTRVGAWLRKTNVDELPQLFNVLRGDMSLVGPRCHAIGMIAAGRAYEKLVPNYHGRHVLRPGITGLAQVRGHRGPTVQADRARQRIACDLYYVSKYSLWLDIKIIAHTLRNEMFGGTGF